VLRDLPYVDDGRREHRLDLWIPRNRTGQLPVVIYIHGGAFHYLSKETHWLMALSFARAGYIVANVEYRLAPEHPFPAAIEDVCRAAQWVRERVESYGGDPDRVAIAGESAGANLATALTLACCQRREEPWARSLFDSGLQPTLCLPACGVLQVSDTARLMENRSVPPWVRMQLEELEFGYLGRRPTGGRVMELADPLLTLERGFEAERPLPRFFTFAGTRDVLLEDSRRLAVALKRSGVPCEFREYEREIHAFHAMLNRPATSDVWRGQLALLDRYL
jgi:acetyl esterase